MKKTIAGSGRNVKKQRKSIPLSGKSYPQGLDALRGLFTDQLRDIYWAEKAILKAIPKMIRKSDSEALAEALKEHLDTTRNQVSRIEEVFSILGVKPRGARCEAMIGLIREAEELMSKAEKGRLRDAGIIAAAQKVEHYEIATYGTLCSLARNIGETEAELLLRDTLEEEKEADEKLTGVAEDIMLVASEEVEEEEEEEYNLADSDAVIIMRNHSR